jgi:hypothetical protein
MAKDKISTPKAAEGNVILLAPDGATSVCINGNEYQVADGFLEVPAECAAILTESHGYVAAE